jgi:hypothetical protein
MKFTGCTVIVACKKFLLEKNDNFCKSFVTFENFSQRDFDNAPQNFCRLI